MRNILVIFLYILGLSLLKLGKFEQSIFCFDTILKINPFEEDAWSSKGYIYFKKMGKFDDAINCFDKLIEINKQNAAAWKIKGLILQKLERENDADECIIKAIELGYELNRLY